MPIVMRVFLRILAVLIGLAVARTLLMVIHFAFTGGFTALAHLGRFGIVTIAAWFIILVAGPVASVQLWRLRRIGLFITAILGGLVFAYYVVGLLFWRRPGAPLRPILWAIIVNAVFLALLLSPAARRTCSS